MPPRHRFHDPIVQEEAPPEPIHALLIERPGIFLHVDDVVAILSQAEGLLAALDYFKAISVLDENPEEVMPVNPYVPDPNTAVPLTVTPAAEPTVTSDEDPRSAGESLAADPNPEVARVEVYPDAEGRWHARPVDAGGNILAVTEGSFDRDYVESDAAERWPSKEQFELGDSMGDSLWDEQVSTFGWNGRRRPSPRRLWTN